MIIERRRGQSLAEYVVLLALIAIVAVVVVAGVGQSASNRVSQANLSDQEGVVDSKTGPPAKPGGHIGSGDSGSH
jgi:hypothetical protein